MSRILKKIVSKILGSLGYKLSRLQMDGQPIKAAPAMFQWPARMENAKRAGFYPKVIFDCGAFDGSWAAEVSQIFPDAGIVLIEPNPHVKPKILLNMSGVSSKTKLVEAAVGNRSGVATLNFWSDQKTDTSASLLDHVCGLPSSSVEVPVKTIDSVAEEIGMFPELLKMDLQGAELEALMGARGVLTHVQLALVEFGCFSAYKQRTTPHALIAFMAGHGFLLYDVVDLSFRPYDNALCGGDFLFVKDGSKLREYQGFR